MTSTTLRERLARLYRTLHRGISHLQWLPGVLMRVTLGVVFLQSGWGKLHHLAQVTAYFTQLGIPAPHAQAVFVSGLELVGGGLVLLGLGTRFISFPLAVTMVVALVTAKSGKIEGWTDVFSQIETLYLALYVILIIQGAGALSLDGLIARWLTRTPAAAPDTTNSLAAAPSR